MRRENFVRRTYKGNMDEFGKILWGEMFRKVERMGVIDVLDYYCNNVLYLHPKTFRRRLADYRLFFLWELEVIQNFIQSEVLENEIERRFKVRK